jgi:hypothetical protein
MSKELLENPDNAEYMSDFTNWVVSVMKGIMRLTKPVKPLLPQMKRTLREMLPIEERREIIKNCNLLTYYLTMTEIEE